MKSKQEVSSEGKLCLDHQRFMDDLVRSQEKSFPEKEERHEEFELEKESANFKKKREPQELKLKLEHLL